MLRALNVSECKKVTQQASFTHLAALEVLDCSKTNAVLTGVSRLPPSLRELRMHNCELPHAADFSHLLHLRVVTRTQPPNQLSATAVASLPPSLEVLDVSSKLYHEVDPWPRGWSLAHMARLRVLKASLTKIDGAVLATLPPSLQVLDLKECDKLPLAASFAHLTCLCELSLRNTPIDGDTTLATLPPSLVSLDLRGTKMRKPLTPATVFPHLPVLRMLYVSHTGLGDAAVASMPAGLEELHMVCCRNVTQHARLDHLAALQVLQSAGTDLSPAEIAACRARGCFAPVDGNLASMSGRVVNLLVPLPDGRLVSGSYNGSVILWKMAAGCDAAVPIAELELYGLYARELAVLHDGHRVAIGVGGIDKNAIVPGGIVLWDTRDAPHNTRVITSATIVCASDVQALAVAHNGRLVAGCLDGGLRVVDADAGAVVTTLAAHDSAVRALAALLDGRVASASAGGEVKLWDVGTGECVSTLARCGCIISSLVVLSDGRLASGSYDNMVRLWDTASGTCMRVLTGHAQPVLDLTVLPGNRLASVAADCTIRVWDTCDGAGGAQPPLVIEYGNNMLVTMLLPLPGNRLAAPSCSGTHLWQLPPPRST